MIPSPFISSGDGSSDSLIFRMPQGDDPTILRLTGLHEFLCSIIAGIIDDNDMIDKKRDGFKDRPD